MSALPTIIITFFVLSMAYGAFATVRDYLAWENYHG